ncbi:MAG TPA: C-terminal binding protein [Roseiflexaceae bacterium]|nr:C-terminal binding protein [Roseiflexaceae bacterium]
MKMVYIPDPVDSLQPFEQERAAAQAGGAELVLGDGANPAIRDAEIILTTWIRFPPEVIRTLERCQLIVRYGIGVDTIDLAAATECGIVVGNAPTYCMHEVADHAAGLALSLARRIPWLSQQVRAGNWSTVQQEIWGVRRLSRLTLGVVGLGKIGRLLVQRMAPFGFRILGYDPYLSDEQVRALGVAPAALDDLLREADIVSLHVPLMPSTRHLIDAAKLSLMKPSAAIVNTSRGPVIDEAALIQALQENRLFGAALDVLDQEPPAPNNPLLHFDPQRVIVTPHFAASSEEIFPDLHGEVAAAVEAVLAGRWPPSVINPDVVPKVPLAR